MRYALISRLTGKQITEWTTKAICLEIQKIFPKTDLVRKCS